MDLFELQEIYYSNLKVSLLNNYLSSIKGTVLKSTASSITLLENFEARKI